MGMVFSARSVKRLKLSQSLCAQGGSQGRGVNWTTYHDITGTPGLLAQLGCA